MGRNFVGSSRLGWRVKWAAAVGAAVIVVTGMAVPADAAATTTKTSAFIATTKVAFGQSVAVVGAVRTAQGTPVAAADVELQARPAGQSTWYAKGKGRTDSNGRVTVDSGPRSTNVAFRFVYRGGSGYAASTSEPVYLATTQTLSLTGVPTAPEVGTDWLFTGTATFGLVGKSVSLQSKVGDTWAKVATATVSDKGTWRATIRPSVLSSKTFRLVFAGDSTVPPTTSATRDVVAYQWFYLSSIDSSAGSSDYEVREYDRVGGTLFRWTQAGRYYGDWSATYNIAGRCTMVAAQVGLRDVAQNGTVGQYEILTDGASRKWGELGIGPTIFVTQSVREAFRVTLSGTLGTVAFGGARAYCSESPY